MTRRSCWLVHGDLSASVLKSDLIQLGLFDAAPELLTEPVYSVKSAVSQMEFDLFVKAIRKEEIEVDKMNAGGLSRLCHEFGFHGLDTKLQAFERNGTDEEVYKMIEQRIGLLRRRLDRFIVLANETNGVADVS